MFGRKKRVKSGDSPEKRGMYFVSSGENIGCFLLYLHELSTPNNIIFAQYPEGNKVEMSPDEARKSLSCGILDFVEVIPRKVYKVCLGQHTKGESK